MNSNRIGFSASDRDFYPPADASKAQAFRFFSLVAALLDWKEPESKHRRAGWFNYEG